MTRTAFSAKIPAVRVKLFIPRLYMKNMTRQDKSHKSCVQAICKLLS